MRGYGYGDGSGGSFMMGGSTRYNIKHHTSYLMKAKPELNNRGEARATANDRIPNGAAYRGPLCDCRTVPKVRGHSQIHINSFIP